ncbi:MAG: glycosyltransferase, partial [Myxococcota bacterium]
EGARAAARLRLGIPKDARVLGFVGRLVRDKGVLELADAWSTLRLAHHDVHLLIVGPVEQRDAVPDDVLELLQGDRRAHFTGFTRDTPALYAAMDVVALPTYREGFPNVPLEASAMGLPVVATRVTGCVDAVVDGVTGTLVPVRDAAALATAIHGYLGDPERRRAHGRAGRARVLERYDPDSIAEAMHALYLDLLEHT